MSDRRTHDSEPALAHSKRPERAPALAIGLGSILSVVLMARHPTTSASGLVAALEELAREAPISGFVHGGLVALVALVAFGYTGFAARLGGSLARVRAGLIAWALGALCLIGAALINGFVLPRLDVSWVGGSEQELELLRPTLSFCHQANQTLAQAGTIALSVAIASWSSVLLARDALARGVGALGLLVGLAAVVGLLSGHLRLHLHGMGAVVLAQALWGVGVAAWLLRRDPNVATAHPG